MSSLFARVNTPCYAGPTLIPIGGLAVAVAVGVAVGTGYAEIAIVLVGATAAFLAPYLSLAHWACLLLLSAVVSRSVVALLGLPMLAVFLHYPIAIVFALRTALQQRVAANASRRVVRWLIGLLILAGASMLGNSSHPLRAAVYMIIVSQPLIIVWAVIRWDPDSESLRRVTNFATILLCVQVPLGLWQGLQFGWFDHVQGTFIDSGNGAHELGAIFALAMIVIVAAMLAGRLPKNIGIIVSAIAIVMITAAGANQVMLSVAPALLCVPILLLGRRDIRPAKGALLLGGGLLVAMVIIVGVTLVQHAESSLLVRSRSLFRPSQLPEVQLVRDRLAADKAELLLGSGPGTTASRASILLTPAMMKESSPLAVLRLPPTEAGMELVNETRSYWGGSAESFASGAFGIIGDLGLLGFAGMALVFASLFRMLSGTGGWLASAAQATLIMTAVLIFIDNWLEYPEYAVPLALLVGFGVRAALSWPAQS